MTGVSVSRETKDGWRAEENVHPAKLKRLSRTIQTYMIQKDVSGDWQFDVIVVSIVKSEKKVRVRYIQNVVL